MFKRIARFVGFSALTAVLLFLLVALGQHPQHDWFIAGFKMGEAQCELPHWGT